MHTKALPPRDMYAPVVKSSCPPVPLIWRRPDDSELIWPNRSTSTQLLMATTLSLAAITAGSLV